MGRTILVCAVSLAAGAAATHFLMSGSAEQASSVPRSRAASGLVTASEPVAESSVTGGFAVPPSLADVVGRPTDFTQTVATYVLAANADETRLRNLITEADGMSHQGDRAAVLGILFSRYADIDPLAALAYLDETGLSPKANLLFRIFNSWSKVDLDAAIDAARDRKDTREQVVANDAILSAHEEQGNDFLNGIRGRLSSADDDAPQSLNDIFRLAASDPEAAVDRILRHSSPQQAQVLAEVAARWAARDPQSAYDYSAQIDDPTLRDWYKRGVFYRWGLQDPGRVVAMLNAGMSREDETLVVNTSFTAMANGDPQAAFEHAQTLEDAAVRSTALQVLMQIWAPSDPASAARAVERLEDGDVRRQIAGMVVTSLVRQSPDAALDWVRASDDGYGQTWRKALQAIAETDPQLAINHAAAVASEEDRNLSLTSVIGTIAQSSPETAAYYWTQIPDEAVRTTTARQIAGEWARRDARSAERWVLGLPAGEIREGSLEQLVASGPYGALGSARLINAIATEERRANALLRPLYRLASSNGLADAETLLDRVAVSAERREQLRRSIRDQATRD